MTEQLVANEKLDGLDIVSIGKLYEGPLEKKYWSSSRGKDRHPYPVGYAALRNNNGNTYKMSILEGLKGPEFTISSTDGQSCSGQTPDIAWEGFQKKSCARIKVMRGKRFSGKINGAELFGFKNPLVMRLLRGLKANGSQITEQNLPLSSFGNGKSKVTHENHCDLEVNLVKTQGKEKRSKKRKEINVKPVSVDEHKRGRSQELAVSGDAPFRSQSENLTILATCNENYKSHLLSAKDGLQFDSSISSEHLEKEKLLPVEETSNFIGSQDLIYIEEGTKSLKNEENLDDSMLNCTPGTNSLKTEDEKGDQRFQEESQMLDTVDLYAPDSVDLILDSTCNLDVEIPKETTCTINGKLDSSQVLVSEKCVTESQSKEEMIIAAGSDNSEKSDSDSIGQEIANSMMTLLLPRALPLLKTFSRKKNTSTNCGKKDVHGISQVEREGTDQCRKDEPPVAANSFEEIQLEKLRGEVQIPDKCFTENLNFEKQNEDLIIPSTDVSSAVAGVDDSTIVAPDTFENDQCEVTEYSHAGEIQETINADQDTNGMHLCTREVHHVCPNNQPNEEADGVGIGILSSMLTVDHVVQKGIIGLSEGVSDGNVSVLPICRDSRGDLVNEPCSANNVSVSDSLTDKMRPVEQAHRLQLDRIPPGSNDTSCLIATVPAHQDDVLFPTYNVSSDVCGESVKCEGQSHAFGYTELFETQGHHEVDSSVSILQAQRIIQHDKTNMVHGDEEAKVAPNDEVENIFELLSCYEHPTPISMVMLRTNGNEVFVCVLCGYSMRTDRTLFFYKAAIKGERKGCPSFIGHTTIVSPISENASGRQILLDSSSLQFTPDGKCLVLLNNIKAPYCREGSVNCPCSMCTSDFFERNAVKVVQVKLGYVQVVCKLKTTNDLCSILVCEPNYLVAAEDGGKMNLWTMNSPWSAPTDQSCLPPSDCMPNCIVQMKRIPNFPALVVGQSAFGDFFLWDLTRRILVSKFSAPITSSLPFIPINVFRCPSQESFTTDACRKNEVADIMEETQRWSLEADKHGSLPVNEDLSLVLFVMSVSNNGLHDDFSYKDSGVTPGGCWSLALLAKSKMVSENTLDPSATVAGAAAGYGINGTCDGSLYIWELSTGTKLGYLSYCKGATVSCLAVDDSDCGAFAVAVNDSQLQVYVPGKSPNKNQE